MAILGHQSSELGHQSSVRIDASHNHVHTTNCDITTPKCVEKVCVHMCVCTYMHVCAHMHVCTCVRSAYAFMCMYVHVYVNVCVHAACMCTLWLKVVMSWLKVNVMAKSQCHGQK